MLTHLAWIFNPPHESGRVKAKFLITYRPESDIQDVLSRAHGYLHVDSTKVKDDLSRFIHAKVNSLSEERKYSDALKVEVRRALLKNTGETFLWAVRVLDNLRRTPKYRV